jgi:hypothetical protein
VSEILKRAASPECAYAERRDVPALGVDARASLREISEKVP